MTWNPALYLANADHRLRAGFELLARVGALPDGAVYDLGCGTGEHALAMAERWPDRPVVGLDQSPAMLAKARSVPSSVQWVEGDIAAWAPPDDALPALIFSNAALQWLERPDLVLRRLMHQLVPGGVLAVQVPFNWNAPSHALLRETAAEAPWSKHLTDVIERGTVLDAASCYDLLAPDAACPPDVWETEYHHPLTGPSPVLTWVEATALRPVRAALDDETFARFRQRYDEKLRKAYPMRADGRTVFPFRRVFVVAMRR